MESADKKGRTFLGTAPKRFDTSLLFYLPDFRETPAEVRVDWRSLLGLLAL